tara:strand:+ start:107 stop:361 length:255 start_codon:yes stop_codon:yes gene_type:complete
MLPFDKKKSIATLIVGAMGPKKSEESKDEKSEESYDDKTECLKEAFKAMQDGDFEAASMHLMDWKFLADQEEDENSHGYSEKEV